VRATSPPAGHGRNNGHVHHWWVEPTDARVGNENLDAVCKLCDATRTFPKFIARQWGGRIEKL